MNSQLAGMEACPGCSKNFKGHRFALLSSLIEDKLNPEHSERFFEDIEKRSWKNLLSTKEWEPTADVLKLYAIKCPYGGMPTVLVRSPFELFYDDYILSIEVLNSIDSQALMDLASDLNWKPLPSL
jgi:hypothetical protein